MPNVWSLQRTTEPTQEPLQVSDLRAHLRITQTAEDSLLQAYISAARYWCEVYQNRQLMTATYTFMCDYFPSWTLKVMMPPLQSVTSIKYIDTDGTLQTLSPSLYLVDTNSAPGRITPGYSLVWPVTRIQINSVQMVYQAGYASAAKVPNTTVQAIKLLAAHYFEHRTQTELFDLHDIPHGITDLLDCDRILDFSGALGSSNNIPGAVTAWGGTGWLN